MSDDDLRFARARSPLTECIKIYVDYPTLMAVNAICEEDGETMSSYYRRLSHEDIRRRCELRRLSEMHADPDRTKSGRE